MVSDTWPSMRLLWTGGVSSRSAATTPVAARRQGGRTGLARTTRKAMPTHKAIDHAVTTWPSSGSWIHVVGARKIAANGG